MNDTAAPEHHFDPLLMTLRFRLGGYDYVVWPSEIVGLVMLIFIGWAFWHAHNRRGNPINLGEMFVWPNTQHTSLAMVMAFVASMVSCWIVIDQELKGKLTGETFVAFLGILVLGKTGTEAINAWRNRMPGNDNNAGTVQRKVETTETNTVIPAPPPSTPKGKK